MERLLWMDGKKQIRVKYCLERMSEKKVVNEEKFFTRTDVQYILKLKGEYSKLSQKDFIKKVEIRS